MKSDRRRRKDKEDGNAKQKCKEADWHGAFYRADYWASVARQFHQIWRIFNILSADSNCGRDGTLWMDCWRMVGFVFGMVVLMSGDATLFLEFRPLATIFIVILKGILAGAVAGIGYKMFEAINTYFAVAIAATLCPLINTSVFLIGCYLFFMEIVSDIAAAFGFEGSGYSYLILGLAGGNFLFELVLNITLCPVIVRIVLLGRKLN